MLAEERKKTLSRYKEYDGCYLGHYAQRFFLSFFTAAIFAVAGFVAWLIALNYEK